MERRFVIHELTKGYFLDEAIITEPELKKRLSIIVLSQQGWGPPDTWDQAIDILLHGEKSR